MRRIITVLALLFALTPGLAAAQADGDAAKFAQSYEAEARGEYDKALEAMKEISTTKRSSYTYRLRRGWLLYKTGEYENSIDWYERAVETEPKAVEPRVGLMLPQMALRRWKDAVETGRKALERDGQNYLASSRLAWSLYNLGRYGEAEKHYRDMVRLYPSDTEMKAGLAWALLKQGDRADAKRYFEDVLDVAPSHQSALEGIRQYRKSK